MRRPAVPPVLLLACLPAALAAAAPAARAQAACPDGRISEVFVDNKSVFDVGSPDLDAQFNWAYRLANRMHVRTREDVVRRELLFTEGDCHDPALLEDSERILRSLSFIAEADVFGVRQPDGSVHVVVETQDEWSLRLEPRMESGTELEGFELREDNLLGTGRHVAGFYKESFGRRVYGAEYGTRQLFGSRWDLDLAAAKTPVGAAGSARIAYPFRGETGRWAARGQIDAEEDWFRFYVPFPDDDELAEFLFEQRRTAYDAGGVVRFGRRGNLTLFGLSLAGEEVVYPGGRRLVPRDSGDAPALPPDSALAGLDSLSNVRIVFLAGQRNLRFDRRRALDAVRGAEDVSLGIEAELGVGRTISAFSDDDDVALDFGFYAARDPGAGLLAGTRLVVEAQRDFAAPADSSEWRNVFGQVDAWAYWRPSPESRHTLVGALRGVGGWHVDVPYQVTLGARNGLRGLPRDVGSGQRRVVGSLEARSYLGWPWPELFDLGTVIFADAGRIWPGDDAFAREARTEASAGFGLRAAFPPDSRRTYRLDVGFPLTRGSWSDVVVTIGVGQAIGIGRARDDDGQLRRSARRPLSASVFSFP